MTITDVITVSELGELGDDASVARVNLAGVSPLETTLAATYHDSVDDRGKDALGFSVIAGVCATAATAAVALPFRFIHNQDIAQMIASIALVPGSVLTVIPASLAYFTLRDYLTSHPERKKAEKLSKEGYVFAHQLENAILVPSAIAAVDTLRLPAWYAVKEQDVSAPIVPLSEISKYATETVIVPAQVTAIGTYANMKLAASAELSGTAMGIIPLEMHGSIHGRVFTEEVSFRIGNSEGNSIPAYLGYVAPHLKLQLPLQLRGYSPVAGKTSVADKTQLVNFLNEAKDGKKQLMLLGKLDSSGNFNVEALADCGTKQAYALAVYQPSGLTP